MDKIYMILASGTREFYWWKKQNSNKIAFWNQITLHQADVDDPSLVMAEG
jgi:hypothetical protein